MKRAIPASLAIVLIAAACVSRQIQARELDPEPRDAASPSGVPEEIISLPIVWQPRNAEGVVGESVYLDGTPWPTASLPKGAIGASLSPSRRYIAYATNLLPGGDIEILDTATGETRTLVDGSERFPGRSLAFPSFADNETSVVFEVLGGDRMDLGVVDLSSGQVTFVEPGGIFNKWPTASPDGKFYLVVCEAEAAAEFSLCLLDREARTRSHLVDDRVSQEGAFTPAGTRVVFIGISGGAFGEGRLKVVDVDGGNETTLVTGLHNADGVLGATSEHAVFTCRSPERPACSCVCVIGLDGSDPTRLAYLGERCVNTGSEESP